MTLSITVTTYTKRQDGHMAESTTIWGISRCLMVLPRAELAIAVLGHIRQEQVYTISKLNARPHLSRTCTDSFRHREDPAKTQQRVMQMARLGWVGLGRKTL